MYPYVKFEISDNKLIFDGVFGNKMSNYSITYNKIYNLHIGNTDIDMEFGCKELKDLIRSICTYLS